MKIHKILTIMSILTAVFQSFGEEQYAEYLKKANEFYKSESYDSAKVYYNKLINNGILNSTVYYNLGNTHFRTDELGEAILYWKKALKYDPGNKDIQTNISFAEARTIDKIPVPEKSFTEKVLIFLHNLISLRIQLWIMVFFLFCISIFLSVAIYSGRNLRLWMIYGASLFTVILSLFLISSGIKIYHNETTQEAVILSQSADAVNQPEGNKILFTIHEGTTVEIKKTRGEWILVQLPHGKGGWMKKDFVGII